MTERDGFRPLYDVQRERGRRGGDAVEPVKSSKRCDYYEADGCRASKEAYRLGLSKAVFLCSGLMYSNCTVYQKLSAGATVMDLYEHTD